jgi:hypothetical protein
LEARTEVQAYREFKPTQLDPNIPFGDERDAWLVAPRASARGVSYLTLVQWFNMLQNLDERDPEGKDYQIHKCPQRTWGCLEIVLVRPDTECARYIQELEKSLAKEERLEKPLPGGGGRGRTGS